MTQQVWELKEGDYQMLQICYNLHDKQIREFARRDRDQFDLAAALQEIGWLE